MGHRTSINLRRGLSTDNKINIILGVLAIIVAVLSAMIAWSTWRGTRRRRRIGNVRHHSEEESATPLRAIEGLHDSRMPYEFAVRFGRNG
ncbi:hypothetical protein VTL71DRAFT_3900 [Oculimacula yallundae]|uniref:Uncharacterized protein n=1 Tax=Oculimacula yallundae TaxID=86028 RepID=A0ABR4C5I4_9HELO